ncbi:MAG: hypothetical protein JO254_05620 [Pseudolabrys sp.]|nr:hypothetical protein [Pseudolabrys sp.]
MLIALYHAAVAGTVALEQSYGAISAHLMVAAGFAAAAILIVAFAAMSRPKITPPLQRASLSERATRIAMLVEALLLGYEATRKSRN